MSDTARVLTATLITSVLLLAFFWVKEVLTDERSKSKWL
jgi:hypothetical protein